MDPAATTTHQRMPPQPPAPRFVAAGDSDITIEWDADPALRYQLQYKEYPEAWEQARVLEVAQGRGQVVAVTASVPDLQPTCTYVLRLVAVSPADGAQSAPSPEIVVDTQAADCTPKPGKRGCCVC